MRRDVKVLPRARAQITSIADWWAVNRSVTQSLGWLDKVEKTINDLATVACQLPLADESDAFEFQLRQINFGIEGRPTHRMLLSIHDDVVFIHCVRHLSRQDITRDDI